MRRLRSLGIPTALALAATTPGWAQMGTAVGLEVLRPSLEGAGDLSSWLFYSNARVAAGPRLTFVFELPVATASGSGDSETRLGNPYLGFRVSSPANVTLDFGLRPPLAKAQSFGNAVPLLVGSLTDFDRFEAFVPELLSVQIRATPRHQTPSGLLVEAHMGGTATVPTEGGETDVLGDYGFRAGYGGTQAEALLGITGRLLLTGDGTIGERTLHQFTARVVFDVGGARPHFVLRFPLDDDLTDIFTYVVGAGITVALR